jgi:hypothetical protein
LKQEKGHFLKTGFKIYKFIYVFSQFEIPSTLVLWATSVLITVAGVVEMSVLKVPPQMRSIHADCPVLPVFVAHGIMSQSALQELVPRVPVAEDTAFCPCVLPERVKA